MTYGHTAVATDDRHDDLGRKREVAVNLSNESGGADDIEGGDTENPAECGSVYCNTTSTIRPTSWG